MRRIARDEARIISIGRDDTFLSIKVYILQYMAFFNRGHGLFNDYLSKFTLTTYYAKEHEYFANNFESFFRFSLV